MPKVIPFGNRILVKRRVVGETAVEGGKIYLPESSQEKETDLAVVNEVPELTEGDIELLQNKSKIIHDLVMAGETKKKDETEQKILELSLKVGDEIMISKYVGTTYHDNKGSGNLTLLWRSDVIGLVVDE